MAEAQESVAGVRLREVDEKRLNKSLRAVGLKPEGDIPTRVAQFAKWALDHDARFIYASSAAVYGDGSLGFSDADALTR